MDNPNQPLDIWGEPVGEKRECFHCGLSYYPNDSDAPEDYRTTYCSLHCYESDERTMKQNATMEARFTNHENTQSSEANTDSEAYTTSKIGDFILKVRKEHKP